MVLETGNPNLRDASCCSVDVVKGGEGFLDNGLFLMSITLNEESLNELVNLSRSIFLSIFDLCFALNIFPSSVENSAVILKDFSGLKFSISFSLSAISLKATDWTLPADKPPLTFLHRTGEIL